LSKHELYIRQWQSINPAFHKLTKSSLKTIDIPHLDDNLQPTEDPDKAHRWTTITDPVILLARNNAHFGQAEGTLFTTQRFQNMFGYGGTTDTAEKFLSKPFYANEFPNMTTGATTLLQLISNNKGLPEISTSINQEEFRRALKSGQKEHQHHRVDGILDIIDVY
jgi:hypothetical protein